MPIRKILRRHSDHPVYRCSCIKSPRAKNSIAGGIVVPSWQGKTTSRHLAKWMHRGHPQRCRARMAIQVVLVPPARKGFWSMWLNWRVGWVESWKYPKWGYDLIWCPTVWFTEDILHSRQQTMPSPDAVEYHSYILTYIYVYIIYKAYYISWITGASS